MSETISNEVLLHRLNGTKDTEAVATLHMMNIKTFLAWLNYHDFPKVKSNG